MASQRIALCIGSGELDRDVYGWREPRPDAPNDDAADIAALLGNTRHGYDTRIIRDPTVSGLLEELRSLVGRLTPRDEFVLYYAGHGGHVDARFDADGRRRHEPDGTKRDVLCLRDGLLLDLEQQVIWATAPAGVSMIAVMDCCYAETSTAEILPSTTRTPEDPDSRGGNDAPVLGHRAAPDDAVDRAMRRDPQWEQRERAAIEAIGNIRGVTGFLLTLGACANTQRAITERGYGIFTNSLLLALRDRARTPRSFEALRADLETALWKRGQYPTLDDFGTPDQHVNLRTDVRPFLS